LSFLAFLLEAMMISLSGVMAPGPVTAVTVGKGSESPHAGALVALGHGAVEFPLMVAVFYGLGALFDLPYVESIVGLVGGLFLLWMGVGMFRSVSRVETDGGAFTRSSMVSGMLLSLGNPYFLVWWATVGGTLILRSARFGTLGVLAFGVAHWSCDLAWSYLLSVVSFKGGQFFGRRFQKVVFVASGVFLVFFGGRFIAAALRGWMTLHSTA
jgi:threonine/homoserine/homoserine lactone efflux protein